jgi:hypothetical protein
MAPHDLELLRAIQELPDGQCDAAAIATTLDMTVPMVLMLIRRNEGRISEDDGVYSLTPEGLAMLGEPSDSN